MYCSSSSCGETGLDHLEQCFMRFVTSSAVVTQDSQRSTHSIDALLKILLDLRGSILSSTRSFVIAACEAASSPSTAFKSTRVSTMKPLWLWYATAAWPPTTPSSIGHSKLRKINAPHEHVCPHASADFTPQGKSSPQRSPTRWNPHLLLGTAWELINACTWARTLVGNSSRNLLLHRRTQPGSKSSGSLGSDVHHVSRADQLVRNPSSSWSDVARPLLRAKTECVDQSRTPWLIDLPPLRNVVESLLVSPTCPTRFFEHPNCVLTWGQNHTTPLAMTVLRSHSSGWSGEVYAIAHSYLHNPKSCLSQNSRAVDGPTTLALAAMDHVLLFIILFM